MKKNAFCNLSKYVFSNCKIHFFGSLLGGPLALHLKDEFVDLEGAPITFVNHSLFGHRQMINDGQVYPSNPKKKKT
jgi:hypothetical protein